MNRDGPADLTGKESVATDSAALLAAVEKWPEAVNLEHAAASEIGSIISRPKPAMWVSKRRPILTRRGTFTPVSCA